VPGAALNRNGPKAQFVRERLPRDTPRRLSGSRIGFVALESNLADLSRSEIWVRTRDARSCSFFASGSDGCWPFGSSVFVTQPILALVGSAQNDLAQPRTTRYVSGSRR